MSPTAPQRDIPVYDLVGVGFGPSNLALAIAVQEHNDDTPANPVTAVFFERQASFGWHRGMLLEDATMQVSFLKDLVTLRNPASRYSFLCYLQDRGRLIDFINHKTFFPLRVEFHDYLEWAAARVGDVVHYGSEVTEVVPVIRDGVIEAFDVLARGADGLVTACRARNLVVATGLRPILPSGVELGERVWHSRDLLTNIGRVEKADRFVVVGAGQSAAEITAFLHEKFPTAEVCGVFSRYGYSPADDSSFANRIFDPAAVDDYFDAPAEVKTMLMNYHSNTNYSVVDNDLIEDLYRRVYRERVGGVSRLRLLNMSRLASAQEQGDQVSVDIEMLTTSELTTLDADVLICATGYAPVDPFPLLGDVADRCERDEFGRPLVDRDYRIRTDATMAAGIYLQGGTEHTHGITASLLSTSAVRSGDILASITAPARTTLGVS
ncbi:lysine N(6)-hydroxylase/L-ornithine N(5)-oxygenase family protein [Actinoplanes sp. TRM 88003]|uniref:L-lysine N6-monooxygenase MbtG n=1 Tax=Paractinoplanes aksuensis TaxID=2939490 RepID=A0ABT1DWJ7_9ACTN|nr:lysine N(6)-hydroxylase/L-ornithine N(5)-oxygenase family protein [Actinoplanes aksuensis]MCO8275198.1 lysine N(6)-hydroxylase/L-ornithine N(5)-oxygenase family protein [Actinoplanes aksuensis]